MSLWGDAIPSWLQGVGTIGAFGFGFELLRRQQAEKRRDQADKVAIWLSKRDGDAIFAVIHNGSPNVITNIFLTVKEGPGDAEFVYLNDNEEQHVDLQPGQKVEGWARGLVNDENCWVWFADARKRRWACHAMTGILVEIKSGDDLLHVLGADPS